MKNATSRLVISAVAMLGITSTTLEVSAFAQEPRKDGAAVTAEPPQREATPAKISVKIPTTLNLPIAKPAIRWSDRSDRQSAPPASQGKGGGKKKWILLAMAGAGGATAAYFLTHKKETPSITVGNPTIGLQ